MATVDLTADTFEATVEEGGILFIDFWAGWCGPCKAFAPVYERVSEEFPDVVFGKVDTEAEQELAGAFGIRSIPTTVVFKEGIGVFMQPGALPEDALRDLVAKVKDLDMDEVRAEIEAQEAAMEAEAAALED
ncbi:MAG: thioredoxin domain-containing protein [archaeon]|jgi:thioredoxin 1|nr:thioredoxin domain-containing protein [archaeon]